MYIISNIYIEISLEDEHFYVIYTSMDFYGIEPLDVLKKYFQISIKKVRKFNVKKIRSCSEGILYMSTFKRKNIIAIVKKRSAKPKFLNSECLKYKKK